ncbi:hypothetical protein [Marinovum sp. 2_MG-2023]|uniref:hypothetical protein n=1 Tax=Marinovum sp. 2_MG-2023 TaxID=3062637 RepID=UPI0026E3E5C0|nr:hypothetical protein [Marinovum sp. 2_MG-2023]
MRRDHNQKAGSRVLVVGFSVTDEMSFVEFARRRTADRGDLTFDKVGIGGWTPVELRHVIGAILDHYTPDYVIYEIATSQLRAQGRHRNDHMASLQALANAAATRGIRRISFFDLPREDVVEQGDWLWAMHKSFCAQYGLGYKSVPLGKDMLRDVVHPSDRGKEVFTDAFMDLLDVPEIPETARKALCQLPNPFSSIAAHTCAKGKPATKVYSRGGYVQDVVNIAGGESVTFDFGPQPVQVMGYSMLLGPTTGAVTATSGNFSHLAKGYDAFCYYERIGAVQFKPEPLTNLTLRQHPDVPETELHKGDKNLGGRTGHIGRFFILTDGKQANAAPPKLTGRARENRLIHLHQPRTGGRSLQQAFRDHLPQERVVSFNPGNPDAVQTMLDQDAWQVFTGSFFALPGRIARQLLALPIWMTVVRDPGERLVSFLHYARAVPQLGAWHQKLKDLSLEDGIDLLVSEESSYAQSSQCRGIVWGEEDPTCTGARRVMARRFRMVCALEHLDQGFESLKALNVVANDAKTPHIFQSLPRDDALLAFARRTLGKRAAEDVALHQSLLQSGPEISEPGLLNQVETR